MESKRRGLFTKSKLVKTLYNRATKPSSTAVHPHNGKRNKLTSVEPTANQKSKDSSFPTSDGGTPAVGFVIVNQEHVYPQPKVAFVVPDRAGMKLENFHGLGVDDEAARYISNVQERFRLEEMQLDRPINFKAVSNMHG